MSRDEEIFPVKNKKRKSSRVRQKVNNSLIYNIIVFIDVYEDEKYPPPQKKEEDSFNPFVVPGM